MNKLINIYEKKGDIKKARHELSEFNVYGIAEISNIISDELIALDKGDLNSEWMKKTRDLRSMLFDLDDWIKKNVK